MAKVTVDIEEMAQSEIEESEKIADRRSGVEPGGFEREA